MQLLFRYLRSPEFVLSVMNATLMVLLWGYEWIDACGPYIDALAAASPIAPSVARPLIVWCVVGLLTIFMLPLSWIYLVCGVAELIVVNDEKAFNQTLVCLSIPNAFLWGFCVAFLYRLIRTGHAAEAFAATCTWSVRQTTSNPLDPSTAPKE